MGVRVGRGWGKGLAITGIILVMLLAIAPIALAEGPVAGPVLSFSRFGFGSGSVHGVVFQDWNEDGQRDAEEPLLAGAVLLLHDAEGNELARVMTGSDGAYAFENLPMGRYTLVEQGPEGYSSLQPSQVTFFLKANQTIALDFANVLWLLTPAS